MSIVVNLPATSANLGPGFDCLGLALGLYNQVTFIETAAGLDIEIHGEGADALPTGETNLVYRAADAIFRRAGRRPAGLRIIQENAIPIGSGLGSSAAAVLGGMLAANALLDNALEQEELLRLAVELEGHPDNVMPAALGGLVLINRYGERLHTEPIPLPPLQVVIVLPRFALSTARARAALPAFVPRADAVFNAGRLALLVRALAAGDYTRLALAMQDRLHQPYRLGLIPGLAQVFASAYAAGAAGVALSGAGPAVIAFAPAGHQQIAQAMQDAFHTAGLPARSWVLPLDFAGARFATRA